MSNRKHFLIAGSVVVGLTGLSVLWAVQGGDGELVATTAGNQFAPSTSEPGVLGDHDESSAASTEADGEFGADASEYGDSSSEPASTRTSPSGSVPQTNREISQALQNLDLSGWEDDELSDDELGIP